MPAPYSPLAVANEFIARSNRGIDHMKLQKLLYYAQGCALDEGFELINEQPQVWKFGPVFPGLYSEMKYHGADRIKELEPENFFGEPPRIPKRDRAAHDVIDEVWGRYSKYTGLQLSDRTHRAGTPWHDTVRRYGGRIPVNTEISKEDLLEYFRRNRDSA